MTVVRRLALRALPFALAACGESSPIDERTPPVITITAPATGATYRGGQAVTVAATAADEEDGALGAARMWWWIDFHHDTHTHPFVAPTQGMGGTVTIPTSGETSDNVFYRVYIRAVNSAGLADTVTRDIQPQKVQLTLQSAPAGLQLTLDGQPRTAPFTVTSVVGIERQVGAPDGQAMGGTTYTFTSWSDAGAREHTVSTPTTSTTYTATFTAGGAANQPPTVALTAPAGGASIVTGTPTALTATAADADGTIAKVEFLEGATVLGEDLTAPYAFTWTPSGTGARSLTARATDDDGAVTTSAAVAVTITSGGGGDTQDPTATITSPANGTTGLTGSVTVTANADDNVGVAEVEFQLDGMPLGTDQTAPYSAQLPATSSYATGVHVFRARARDAAGNTSPWSAARVTFGGNVNLTAGFTESLFVTGLPELATTMAFAPDGRLFICQQGGALRVVKNGSLLATPFVTVPTAAVGERGLLGVTFDPAFATNGWVYVYYTVTSGGATFNRISRFTANGDVAAAGSEVVLLDLPNLSGATNHNGGALHFGPDGKLYVAVGDNANTSTPQSLASPFGKMLRLNPDGSIPTDNPFYAQATGVNRAIWALGLRNPFTFGFQPGTGRMHINDVGQDAWEEINLGRAGANYGWPTTEGATTNPAFDSPIFAYGHGANPTLVTGFSIVGAAFYNPATPLFPANYVGNYFFADYVSQWVYRLDLANGNAVYAFARPGSSITDVRVGPDGALYVLALRAGGVWGVIRYAPS